MNPEILAKVLACPTLPTLPAVAVRVLELVNDERSSVAELAETLTVDQALATRVLRTVNSSFYGLRKPCATISQAIVMLGLSAVKTLALGFSLVGAISQCRSEGFDYVAYWRRGLYSGIAARCIARQARSGKDEECFLGGLLQDVGMIALQQALGPAYSAILRRAGADHRALARIELAELDTQHADIGSLLARRWKLPEELVMPVKYHERPTAAPAEHRAIVRAVALGNIAADVLTAEEAAGPLTRFIARAEEWFGLSAEAAEGVLKQISQSARELARLLQVDAGQGPDAEAILAQAHQRLLTMSVPEEAEPATAEAPGAAGPAARGRGDGGAEAERGTVTGLPGRQRLSQKLISLFEQAKAGAGPLALAVFDVDGLGAVNEAHGRDAGDALLRGIAGRIGQAMSPVSAAMFATAPGRLVALMPRTDRVTATRMAEMARRQVHAVPFTLEPEAPVSSVSATVSVGLACVEPAVLARLGEPAELLGAAEEAVRAAKAAGRNTVRVWAPAGAVV